jgi:hypothetical protein
MNPSWRKCVSTAVLAILLCLLAACARDQQLVSIDVQPTTETFGDANTPVSADAGLNVQLRALGTYIHPPVTKDITKNVVWTSNTPAMVTVDANGVLAATGGTCGNALVSATLQTNSDGNRTASGAIVTGFMTANVVCFTPTGHAISAGFAGKGAGTISSSPSGLGCATTCTADFPPGTTVTLTAAPNGSTFGGWVGCDAVSGPANEVCTIRNVQGDKALTVTFN